jgi:hypothetical protein
MEMLEREPGTYRTRAGSLVHFRPRPDGGVAAEHEDPPHGRLGGEADLVKLSDDPDWPDLERASPVLFAD